MAPLLRKLGLLFGRSQFRSDLDEEMAFHRAQMEKDLEAAGMTADAARKTAAQQFGNVTRLRERSHEAVGFKAEALAQDLRFALRQLRKNPGFAATAVLILALGMGASVAIFGFVDAALIKPLPYEHPQRLVRITESDPAAPNVNISYADFVDWKRMNSVLDSMEVFTGWSFLLSEPGGAEPVPAARVSSGFFRTLGVAPMLGRDFRSGEDSLGSAKVVMLSYGAWQSRFGGRKDVIGEAVTLSGESNTVIGVLPKDFAFAPEGNAEFWAPLRPESSCEKRRDCHNLYAVGRLKNGASVRTALENLQSIARQLELHYPDTNRGRGASVMPLSEAIVGDMRPIFLVLLGGAGLLLLIACVNVCSLLLVRTENRKREVAVRGALGASRVRLARQFVTEGVVLVAGGAVVGLALADAGMRVLCSLISKDLLVRMPYVQGLGLNAHVLVFAAMLALLASITFSAAPVLHLLHSDMRDGLTEGGRTAAGMLWRRVGAHLVVIELATAMVLLTGAGLLGKSLYRLLHVDLGFDPSHLATVRVGLPETAFAKDEQIVAFVRKTIERVERLPGVRSAAVTTVLPVSCNCNTDWLRIVGRPYNGIHITVNERDVTSEFFATLRTRLLSGRYFTDAEDASKPKVAVINRTFARQYFPGEDPVGQRIGDPTLSPASIKQIVGVVDDFKDGSLDEEQKPAAYYPFSQNASPFPSLIVRTSQNEQSVLPLLPAVIHQFNTDVGVDDEATLTELINQSQSAYLHRSTAYLVGGFAVAALLLGVVGLYGVIAYSVSQRTREIGVRMALGAQRRRVCGMVMRQAGWLTLIGVGAGLACSIGASMAMHKLLFRVAAWDAETLTAVAVLLGGASLAASFLPARRAASVNPVEALRAE